MKELKQNNLEEATTGLGFVQTINENAGSNIVALQREVELEDGTIVTVEGITPAKMKTVLNNNANPEVVTYKTPGEDYVVDGEVLIGGVCQAYNGDIPEPGGDIVGIYIDTLPNKTQYFLDETFDPDGMVVMVEYKDGNTEEVTDYTWTPTTPLTYEDTTITIEYRGYTTTVDIEVFEDAPLPEYIYVVTDENWKEDYVVGEQFSTNGLTVFMHYEGTPDEEDENVTEFCRYSVEEGHTWEESEQGEWYIKVEIGDPEEPEYYLTTEAHAFVHTTQIIYCGEEGNKAFLDCSALANKLDTVLGNVKQEVLSADECGENPPIKIIGVDDSSVIITVDLSGNTIVSLYHSGVTPIATIPLSNSFVGTFNPDTDTTAQFIIDALSTQGLVEVDLSNFSGDEFTLYNNYSNVKVTYALEDPQAQYTCDYFRIDTFDILFIATSDALLKVEDGQSFKLKLADIADELRSELDQEVIDSEVRVDNSDGGSALNLTTYCVGSARLDFSVEETRDAVSIFIYTPESSGSLVATVSESSINNIHTVADVINILEANGTEECTIPTIQGGEDFYFVNRNALVEVHYYLNNVETTAEVEIFGDYIELNPIN